MSVISPKLMGFYRRPLKCLKITLQSVKNIVSTISQDSRSPYFFSPKMTQTGGNSAFLVDYFQPWINTQDGLCAIDSRVTQCNDVAHRCVLICFKQQLRSIAQRNKIYQALATQTEGQFIVGLRLFMEFGDNKKNRLFSVLFFFKPEVNL